MWWVFALPHFSSVLVLWWAFALPHSSSALVLWWVLAFPHSSSALVLWWVPAFPHSWTRKRPYGKTCWLKLSRVQKKTCWLKLSRVAPPAEWTVFFQWQIVRTGWLKTQIKGDYTTMIQWFRCVPERTQTRTADPMLHIQQFATDSHMILASASFLTNSGSNCRVAECWSPK